MAIKLNEEDEKEIEDLEQLCSGINNGPVISKTGFVRGIFIFLILLNMIFGFLAFFHPWFVLQMHKKIFAIFFPNLESEIQYYWNLFLTDNIYLSLWPFFIISLIITSLYQYYYLLDY